MTVKPGSKGASTWIGNKDGQLRGAASAAGLQQLSRLGQATAATATTTSSSQQSKPQQQ